MYTVRPPRLAKFIFSKATWRMPEKEKSIYLTFDDGPIPEITSSVLKTLKEYNAKATFFCIGDNVDKHPEIFREIITGGHSIGNHTYCHINGWKTSASAYLKDIEECKKTFTNNLGQVIDSTNQKIPLFRPPYGRMRFSQFSMLKTRYSIIMWDVLCGDFDKNTSKEQCLKNAIFKTRNGSIVVFHDSLKAKENLYYVLPRYLKHFSERGFEFKRIDI